MHTEIPAALLVLSMNWFKGEKVK